MRYWIVLLTAVLAAGCASVSMPTSSTSSPALNQEEQISKLLIGTWNGYIRHPRVVIGYNMPTLQIFGVGVKKTAEGGWFIDLSLNYKRIDGAELTVNTVIRIEFIERYGNILIHHDLVLDGDRRLVGKIWYGTRQFTPAEVTFDKVY